MILYHDLAHAVIHGGICGLVFLLMKINLVFNTSFTFGVKKVKMTS